MENKLDDKIIHNVKRIMKDKKINQRYISAYMGNSPQMVSFLLNKERKLNLGHVESISKALDVEVFELVI
tara:strand:+ start:262 stop:471 length:210 start_codon:yes stop_codon:yes gene_type:complete